MTIPGPHLSVSMYFYCMQFRPNVTIQLLYHKTNRQGNTKSLKTVMMKVLKFSYQCGKHLAKLPTADAANAAWLGVHWKDDEEVLNICSLSGSKPVGIERDLFPAKMKKRTKVRRGSLPGQPPAHPGGFSSDQRAQQLTDLRQRARREGR